MLTDERLCGSGATGEGRDHGYQGASGMQVGAFRVAIGKQTSGTNMPTIVLASPKGGAGKTTSAVLLATELAQSGAAVTVIDADPNRNISEWAARPGRPEGL